MTDGFPPIQELLAGEKKDSKGVNLLSLVSHINSTPAWDGALRFNLLTEGYEICGQFPPHGDRPKEKLRPLEDPRDILRATMYFQANGFPKAVKASVTDAISAVAHEHGYHPVRDYLNRLKWDGEERVGKLFEKYYKAEMPTESVERERHASYLTHISTGFMVGAVARVRVPGCKHDHVPVLVSNNQGLLKSSSILALCADPAWFSDNLPPDLADRDTKEFLRGKWLIELSEIPHVRREVERMKAFVASPNDRYRAAYGRFNQDHPRQCGFIGTSNDLEFADVTGNRRFWPFRISEAIDVEAIIRDRDQLWAEAADMYSRGVKWWLPPDVEKIAAEKQEAFVEADLWDGLITTWLDQHPDPFTMEDLFAKDTGITPYRETAATTRTDEMRAARCLKKLGLHKDRYVLNGKRAVWWQRKKG